MSTIAPELLRALLGMPLDATDDAVVAELTRAYVARSQLLALTNAPDPATALAVVATWRDAQLRLALARPEGWRNELDRALTRVRRTDGGES